MLPTEPRFEPHQATLQRIASSVPMLGLYALLGGLTSFAGWLLDVPLLTDWGGTGISIQPNATLAVAATGASLLALAAGHPRAAALLGALVAAIGVSALGQYLTGVNLERLNTLLMFDRSWGRVGVAFPGRMGPPGSLCWTLIGAALVLRAVRPAQPRVRRAVAAIALATLAVATLSITGYVFGTDRLYSLPYLTVIALQTATFIAAASLALLATVPERPPVRWLAEPGAAGTVARRALPFVVLVPFVLGWLSEQGLMQGWYDPQFRAALLVLVLVVLLLGLLSWTLDAIARHESAQRVSEQRLSAALAERVEAERALRDGDQRKDAFIATLAHELRGPLAPVTTALELLSREGLEPAVAAKARQTMRRQLRQMVRLIDDLLDVGRISRDKLELRLEPVELRPLLEQTIELCEPLLQRQDHELVQDLPDGTVWLHADGARLVQVFGNVLGNACKYTPPGGRVELSARRQGGRIELSVRDSGQGIPPDQLEAVFEPFCQLGKGLEQHHGGLGIGLYLARRLARLHGGEIEAHSDGPGCGSLFVITLPLASRDEADEAPRISG
jgi:signal transduction histidine kinase